VIEKLMNKREFWSSRVGFILATMASAIGLGSIWKFPYEVGTNGGGAFVLFYILGQLLIVFPLMLVELAIGRRGRSDAIQSIAIVSTEGGGSPRWRLVGGLGVVTATLILSFYSVIGGWAFAYAVETAREGLSGQTAAALQARYDVLLASPLRMIGYHALFMGITAFVVARGISGGIEAASKLLMPVLIVLLVLLAAYSLIQGDSIAALRFLFSFDLGMVSPKALIEALGLGFFSIGVGLAVMVTYAAYARQEINLGQAAVITLIGDTAISFLAGLAIFPIVFAENLDPSSGPGLMFVTVPLAFSRVPFGTAAATAFFVLLALAALGSAISMLEMPVAAMRRSLGWSRQAATLVSALACWAVGLGSVLSFNQWNSFFPLAVIPGFERATIFDALDQLTSNILLPVGGLGLCILGGWVIGAKVLATEINLSPGSASVLRILLRYIAPLGIAIATCAPFLT
jgi:NSS family neurotransmitter:Na+ symporter